MVLKNIVDIYNECYKHINEIEKLESKLNQIIDIFNSTFSNFCKKTVVLNGGFSSDHSSNMSTNLNTARHQIEYLLTNLFVDIFEISQVLTKFESYKQLNCDNSFIYIDDFINKTKKLTRQINCYFESKDLSGKSNVFFNTYICINEYLLSINNFKNAIKLVNGIYDSTSYDRSFLLKDDSYSIIEIQYFSKELKFSDMSEIMESTESLYNKLCEIFGISLTQYKLKPIKIESGSIYESLAGNASIIAIMEILFKNLKNPTSEFTKFIYRNHTDEGLHKNACEFFKNDLELFECAEKFGLKIPKEIAEENLAQISKHTNNFLNKGKFKVNGNEIISEDPEQLKIAPTSQIECNSLNVNESDINSSDDDIN